MFNPELDFAELMLTLQRTGRVVINNAFAAEVAESLYEALRASVHSNLKSRDDAQGQRTLKNAAADAYAQGLNSARRASMALRFAGGHLRKAER